MFALTRNPFLKFSAAGSSTEGRETVRQILIEMLSKNDAIEMLGEKGLHQLLRGLRQNQSPTGDRLIAILKRHLNRKGQADERTRW
jgi:hypothetical protein